MRTNFVGINADPMFRSTRRTIFSQHYWVIVLKIAVCHRYSLRGLVATPIRSGNERHCLLGDASYVAFPSSAYGYAANYCVPVAGHYAGFLLI